MAFSIEILIFALFTIIAAIVALEAERLSRAIVSLALSSIGIGTIFLFLGATYAGLFELLIYGGVLLILFLVVASFVESEDESGSDKEVTS
jgi:NADH:ubiquinone oxidoreductase subunit 6 (subunit J)